MDDSKDARFTPDFGWDEFAGGLAGGGSALVCIDDARVELATMLVLQELDVSVDLAGDLETALRWVRQARYDLIVSGGGGVAVAPLALRLRHAAPHSRVIVLADERQPADGLAELRVEVMRPPLDVNALMRVLRPAA